MRQCALNSSTVIIAIADIKEDIKEELMSIVKWKLTDHSKPIFSIFIVNRAWAGFKSCKSSLISPLVSMTSVDF